MKFRWKFLVLTFLIFFWNACTNKDKKAGVAYDRLYFDYTVTAEEDGPFVTCMLQYKKGGLDGDAINVTPGKVELDGQRLEGDSAGLSGYYYEIQRPVDSFSGKHTIVFTDPDDKVFKEEFEFIPFTLAEELPEKISRKPFTIQLKNFPKRETPLRLLLLDTAFESKGFNDMISVVNGKVEIDQAMLNNLKNGPINIALYMEKEIPVKQPTKAGGRVSITYGLKREFELVD